MLPEKFTLSFRVAELPTCQKMLAALAAPCKTILELVSMSSVLAGIWKTHVAFGSEEPRYRVSPTPTFNEDPLLYSPGASGVVIVVSEARSRPPVNAKLGPASVTAAVYAVTSALAAAAVLEFVKSSDPFTTHPAVHPVSPLDVPAVIPIFPLIVLDGVSVMAE